jgi:hypothetical protein
MPIYGAKSQIFGAFQQDFDPRIISKFGESGGNPPGT